jgi:hypothetical protein
MRKNGVMSAAPLMPLKVAVAEITMHAGNMNQYTSQSIGAIILLSDQEGSCTVDGQGR